MKSGGRHNLVRGLARWLLTDVTRLRLASLLTRLTAAKLKANLVVILLCFRLLDIVKKGKSDFSQRHVAGFEPLNILCL